MLRSANWLIVAGALLFLNACSQKFDITADHKHLRQLISKKNKAGLQQFIDNKGVLSQIEIGGGHWVHPIHVAASSRSRWGIEQLILAGANVNSLDSERQSVLYWALSMGGGVDDEEIIRFLLDKGADIEQKLWFDKRTLLQIEISIESQSSAQLLLDLGANVNATNSLGETALHLAIGKDGVRDSRILDTVELLLRYGAAPNVKNFAGTTPTDLAKQRNIPGLLELLQVGR